jgi:hypothetical protein
VLASTCCLPFDTFLETIVTFHSSGQSFMAHYTCSLITQYLNCSHTFLGSPFTWIHILCLEA